MFLYTVLSGIAFTFVCFISCEEDDMRKEWKKHLHRVSHCAFPCAKPQNRTVDIQELVDKDTWTEIKDLYIMPRRTVLQRCFSAGSCQGNFRCLPSEVETRHLIFGVKDHHLTFMNISAEDHISCMCQPSPT